VHEESEGKSIEQRCAMGLRKRGIYSLPNGRELVVLGKHENGCDRLGGWQCFELTEYEVNDAGRLICNGRLTAWDISDLKDTGGTAAKFAHPFDKSEVNGQK
jgi:hypothetical protein